MGSTSRRLFLGSAVAVGIGSAVAVRLPRQARATRVVGGLEVLCCADWGARPPRGPVRVLPRRPDKIVVHHTATANSADLSRAQAVSVARGIQNLHMDARHWPDTGHHFTVTRGGFVLEGRHGSLDRLRGGVSMVEGAHCVGQNGRSIGIENEGTYTDAQPPELLWRRLVELCEHVCRRYRLPPTEIFGHNDFSPTLCPGLLRARLPDLRRAVAAALG